MADVDLKLSERADSAATCVYCREPLGDARISCAGCGVGLHASCRDELSKCPTMGCAQTWARAAARPARAPAPATQTPRAATQTSRAQPPGVASRPKLPWWVLGVFGLFALTLHFVGQGARLDPEEEATERARHDEVMRRADEQLALAEKRRAAGGDAASTRFERDYARLSRLMLAIPLNVAGQQEATWRAGTLEAFGSMPPAGHEFPDVLMKSVSLTGSANGLKVEDARWLLAGARQRVLAALPPAAADAWATFAPGTSARVRVDFDREEEGLRDATGTLMAPQSTSAALLVTFVLEEVRPDAVQLRATIPHPDEAISWSETWPRQVDAALRATVRARRVDPGPTVVLPGDSPSRRHVAADTGDVSIEGIQEDALPLPWKATVARKIDTRSCRVRLELLEWVSKPCLDDGPRTPAVETPDAQAAAWARLGPAAAAISARPLRVDQDGQAVWRMGLLDAFDHAKVEEPDLVTGVDPALDSDVLLFNALTEGDTGLGLSFEDARWLFAALRLRANAYLPGAEDLWWSFEGASARVRVQFTRCDGPTHAMTTRTLEATIEHLPQEVRRDTFQLRVTVRRGDRALSWLETWPRRVDPAFRNVNPGSDVDRLSVTSNDDDGLPVPTSAAIRRHPSDQRSYHVELERLEWVGPR